MSNTSSHENSHDAAPAADTPAFPDAPATAAPGSPVGTDATPSADAGQPNATTTKAPKKSSGLAKRIGATLLAGAAVLGVRLATADDGTHGIQVGQCVAERGSDDFEQVDCSSTDSVGKVTFMATDSKTSEDAALDLCDQHGADTAYTSASTDGGDGTVICVASK